MINKIQYELSKIKYPEFAKDSRRIMNIAFRNGVLITQSEAEEIWEEVSGKYFASWLNLPETDKELWEKLIDNSDE